MQTAKKSFLAISLGLMCDYSDRKVLFGGKNTNYSIMEIM